MWRSKIIKQMCICVILVMAFLAARHTGIPALQQASRTAVSCISKNYSVSDVMAAAKESVQTAVRVPAAMTNTIISAREKTKYGTPIDKAEIGETVSVYAVGAGTVTSVGENDEIGKFLKITHGDEAVSIYGNCETILVKELDRVKKGQAIATFKKEADNEFYYSFSDFRAK